MSIKAEQAVSIFENGFNCAQAVLSVFSEELGLANDTALMISCGFGGGCRNGELCGAVAGAIMVIGLKCGHQIHGDTTSKQFCYAKTKEFTDKFKALNSSIVCEDLLGVNIASPTPEEKQKLPSLFATVCHKAITDAVAILEDMIEKQ